MNSVKFSGPHALGEFVDFLFDRADAAALAMEESGLASAEILYATAEPIFGDADLLAPLAASTQDEREALGFSRDEPLLRDGSLLRAHVEKAFEGSVGSIGSPEIIQKYHELGYINARTGTSVPPRPVFLLALQGADPALRALADDIAGVAVGALVKLKP